MSLGSVCLALFVSLSPLLLNSPASSGHLHYGRRTGPDFQLLP